MRKLSIIMRASAMLGAISILTVGATFAALTSTATLTANTLASATPALQIQSTGSVLASTDAGFAFTGIVPGANYGTSHNFNLKNNGDTNLSVALSTATLTTGTGTIDHTKVHFKVVNTTASGSPSGEYTLASLESLTPQNLPGVSGTSNLGIGVTNSFTIQVKMDADAITGGPATLSSFDFVFTGTAE